MVPQGMSYASLAGLPSVYGLYGAFVPVLCYAALGSSRHLVRSPIHPALASISFSTNIHLQAVHPFGYGSYHARKVCPVFTESAGAARMALHVL